MAHLEPAAQLQIDIDVTKARRAIKRVIADAGEANRELAQLQEHLDTLGGRLAAYGIRLEVEERHVEDQP